MRSVAIGWKINGMEALEVWKEMYRPDPILAYSQ